MRRLTMVSGLVACLAAVPTGIRAQEVTLSEGGQVYAATCSRCHNPRSPSERSDAEWDVIMAHMRTRGNLSGRETRAVLYFLQATNVSSGTGEHAGQAERPGAMSQGPGGATPDTDQVASGLQLVEQKACMACHKIGPHKVGTVGPNLNTVLTRRDAHYVLRKLESPTMDNPASVMPQMNLSAEQREAILAYIVSISKK